MVKAILKLVVLSGSFVILTLFALFFVRWMGFQQGFAPPPHPWFEKTFWSIYTASADEICKAENLDALLPSKDWIISIPVKRSKDEQWVIPCTEPLPLGDLLKREQHMDYVLNVQAHDTWDLDKLVETVDSSSSKKRFALLTDSQKVAMYLRKKAPQWLFAADGASLARLKVFESLWIESAMEFRPDFVISKFSTGDAVIIDERMSKELERRGKRVVWNMESGTDMSEKPHLPYQGIMTTRPSAVKGN